jgi:hypothetical protein
VPQIIEDAWMYTDDLGTALGGGLSMGEVFAERDIFASPSTSKR